MARVKGTILIDFVKTIRADKTGAYERRLTERDREIVAERILPSYWYPHQTFKHCFEAVVAELAKGDMGTVKQWGRIYGENIIKGFYKSVIKEGEPMETLMKYTAHIRNLFDFGEIEIEPLSENQAMVTIKELTDFEPLFHMTSGWFERSLELAGARDIEQEIVSKAWEGDPETKFKMSWKM